MGDETAAAAGDMSSETSTPVEIQSEQSETSAPPAQEPTTASVSAPDYQAQFQSIQSQLSQYQQYFQSQQEQIRQQNEQFRNLMMQTVAPEQYRQMQAPQYVTRDQFERAQQNMVHEAKAAALYERYQGEVEIAKEKFPDLFADFPNAPDMIAAAWTKSDKSAVAIAKEMNDGLSKSFERRQAKYTTQKQETANQTKTGIKAGVAPGAAKANGARGFARLRAALGGG